LNIAEHLFRAARTYPDRPAIAVGRTPLWTWRQMADRAGRLAAGLGRRFGLAPGDRVALAMKNDPAFLELLYAAWIGGYAAVPINAKLHAREFAYILDNSGAKAVFVTPNLGETLAEAKRESGSAAPIVDVASAEFARLYDAEPLTHAPEGADALAWIFYTSGTTGRPKGAMLSHRNLLAMTLSYYVDVDHVGPRDAIIHAAPISHGSGLYIMAHVAMAATQIIPDSGQFDPPEIFDLCRHWTGVTMFAAPTMVKRLTDHPEASAEAVPGLKTVVYGGGPMYVADLKAALSTFGQKFVQIYGQGESPMCITSLPRHFHADADHPRYEARLGSTGIAQSVVQVKVTDENDAALPVGETGEILARGDCVMQGYFRDAAATAKALKGGWLHTGDVGAFDADGFLTLKDRSKDLIISGGSNIYPREVEEVLLRHDGVAEVSIVGAPDAEWGEVVIAFVVARPGATVTQDALDRLCLDNIARFKRPKQYRFLDALPKNNYGKILKTELRQLLDAAKG